MHLLTPTRSHSRSCHTPAGAAPHYRPSGIGSPSDRLSDMGRSATLEAASSIVPSLHISHIAALASEAANSRVCFSRVLDRYVCCTEHKHPGRPGEMQP